ncbi:MAG: DNA starvation/stationary phase protection protein [Thermanaerothrix sp.]|nr:DNA starvation/stationary phase protection protein [Thermanaerothrix sp.]
MATQTPVHNVVLDSRQPEVHISDAHREAVINLLNTLLADEHVLLLKTHNYHWNVIGPNFAELHELFGEQYEMLDDLVDEIAERARMLGGKAVGTMREYLERTRLSEEPGIYPNAEQMIINLVADHEAIIRYLRQAIDDCAEKYGDIGTSDLLTGVLRAHEKMAWFLRAHLQK